MQRSVEKIVEEQVKLVSHIKEILDDAAYAERFVSKPNNNRCPSMYQIIETSHLPSEIGYYEKKLKLIATPRQMTNYGLAIDLLFQCQRLNFIHSQD